MHLSVAHFSEQLLARHPFTKDTECSLCVQDKRPKVILSFSPFSLLFFVFFSLFFSLFLFLLSCAITLSKYLASVTPKHPPCQVFLMERKSTYAKHLGQLHLLVLELVTPEQREMLQPGKRGRKAKQQGTGG